MAQLAKDDFSAATAQLLKQYRDGDLYGLFNSPLLPTPLFTEMLLLAEPLSMNNIREVVQAILQWGLRQLQPAGEQNWHDNFWRHYNVLAPFYLQGEAVAVLAEKMGIAEQTFYEWRSTAVSVFAQILYQECYQPRDLYGRQLQLIRQKYQQLSNHETRLLNLATISASPLPLRPLFNAQEINIFKELEDRYLLVFTNEQKEITQPDNLHHLLNELLSEEQRVAGHSLLHEKFLQADILPAAIQHAYASGDVEQTVQLAVQNEAQLFQQGDAAELQQLWRKIVELGAQGAGVDTNQWAQFLMIAAKTAEWAEALDLALDYSRQALSAPDNEVKIKAYYQRAKLLSRVNLDECLSHYAVCLDLIERSALLENGKSESKRLATRMLIDRAWIFIQERPNYARADADLQRAESLIPAADSALWCDLYNVRAGLIARSQSAQEAMPYRLQALTSAEASGDIERMTKMAYNVGMDTMFGGDYENGRYYLRKSLEWALTSGNQQTLGLAHKGLGNCAFFTADYAEAIVHYKKAFDIWCTTNNKNWQVYISYDLVEAYATVGEFAQARQQLEFGKNLAAELGNERILAELEDLTQTFPALQFELGERQAQALAYLNAHNSMTRQQYIDLTGVAKSQAYRDLDEMCQLGLIERCGKGRGTHYMRV